MDSSAPPNSERESAFQKMGVAIGGVILQGLKPLAILAFFGTTEVVP